MKDIKFQSDSVVRCGCGFVCRYKDLERHSMGCKSKEVHAGGEIEHGRLKDSERAQWFNRQRKAGK